MFIISAAEYFFVILVLGARNPRIQDAQADLSQLLRGQTWLVDANSWMVVPSTTMTKKGSVE
jgi:hypothetical protein